MAANDDRVIIMSIGGYVFSIGSSADDTALHPMDVAPCIIDDRTYVPVRFIAEATGYNVSLNGDTRTVIISGAPTAAPDEEYEIKGSFEFYGNSVDAVDFGKLNNLECTGAGETPDGYKYDYPSTGADVVNYVYAIKAHGYEMSSEPFQFFGLTIMDYAKDGRNIHISYDKGSNTCSITLS